MPTISDKDSHYHNEEYHTIYREGHGYLSTNKEKLLIHSSLQHCHSISRDSQSPLLVRETTHFCEVKLLIERLGIVIETVGVGGVRHVHDNTSHLRCILIHWNVKQHVSVGVKVLC